MCGCNVDLNERGKFGEKFDGGFACGPRCDVMCFIHHVSKVAHFV